MIHRNEKKSSLGRPETWHDPYLKWHGRATLCQAKTQTHSSLAWPVPILAWPCPTSKPSITQHSSSSSSLILLHKHLSSSKLLSKTSITNNLQTFISPSKLHQFTKFLHLINPKHNSNHNPSIKNNFHPPKPKITQIRHLHNPNPKTTNSSPNSTTQLINLT